MSITIHKLDQASNHEAQYLQIMTDIESYANEPSRQANLIGSGILTNYSSNGKFEVDGRCLLILTQRVAAYESQTVQLTNVREINEAVNNIFSGNDVEKNGPKLSDMLDRASERLGNRKAMIDSVMKGYIEIVKNPDLAANEYARINIEMCNKIVSNSTKAIELFKTHPKDAIELINQSLELMERVPGNVINIDVANGATADKKHTELYNKAMQNSKAAKEKLCFAIGTIMKMMDTAP